MPYILVDNNIVVDVQSDDYVEKVHPGVLDLMHHVSEPVGIGDAYLLGKLYPRTVPGTTFNAGTKSWEVTDMKVFDSALQDAHNEQAYKHLGKILEALAKLSKIDEDADAKTIAKAIKTSLAMIAELNIPIVEQEDIA